jgi:hypothetical protein
MSDVELLIETALKKVGMSRSEWIGTLSQWRYNMEIIENKSVSIENPRRFIARYEPREPEPAWESDTVGEINGWRLDIMDSVIECPQCGNMLEQDCPKCGDCGATNPWIGLVF